MQTTIKLQNPTFAEVKTYMAAALFIAGNIALPQLFHLIPQGGITWLPIYFFTLVGAYMFGWRVGLLTALASPLINSMLFGMPVVAVLPAIMLKSVLLALIAGLVASRYHRATLLMLIGVVVGYQLLGTIGEWAMTGDLNLACQDLKVGLPGMLLQIFGGWVAINLGIRRANQ